MRDTILIGVTHGGKSEQILGVDSEFAKQMDTFRAMTRTGYHEKFAEVWQVRPIRRTRRLLTPAQHDKKRSDFAAVLKAQAVPTPPPPKPAAKQATKPEPKPQAEAQKTKV